MIQKNYQRENFNDSCMDYFGEDVPSVPCEDLSYVILSTIYTYLNSKKKVTDKNCLDK